VANVASQQVTTIQYSVSETLRLYNVTMTLIDDVSKDSDTIHDVISQVTSPCSVLYW